MGFGGTLWGSSGSGPVPPPGTLQAQSYIYLALRRIGHLRPGYQPSPELLNDLLLEWQLLFDALNMDRNIHYTVPSVQYPITGPGSQTGGNGYLIGPTATTAPATQHTEPGGPNDWLGPRPESIVAANLVMLNVPNQPVYLPLRSITVEAWASLAIKQIPPISVTSLFFYDGKWPNGIFNVFPPLSPGNAVQLFTFGVMQAPTSLTDAYGGPPGYAEMVVCCMAVRAYPLISKHLSFITRDFRELKTEAYAAIKKIQAINRPIQNLKSDFPARQNNAIPAFDSFVYLTGQPY